MFKWLVNYRLEEKRGEKKQQQKREKGSYNDKAEGLWSVELKRCHVDDLVSGGGKHRTQNVWCLFWFSKETLVWVILAFCEAHENIHKHRVWSCADRVWSLTFWMYVWIHSMVGFCPQIWQFSPMCLHWSMFHLNQHLHQCGYHINLHHTCAHSSKNVQQSWIILFLELYYYYFFLILESHRNFIMDFYLLLIGKIGMVQFTTIEVYLTMMTSTSENSGNVKRLHSFLCLFLTHAVSSSF